jgi:signal transduction histidine kinase
MRERAILAGGVLDVISEPGKGTQVILKVLYGSA